MSTENPLWGLPVGAEPVERDPLPGLVADNDVDWKRNDDEQDG